jgi:2,5-diketo-D-gluconate reductase A
MPLTAQSRLRLPPGNAMPLMGLGTWELTRDTAGTIVRAFGLGYALIDTACDYGSQAGIGEALRGPAVRRDAVYLVAKIEETDDPVPATRRYLAELGVEYADLVLLHRPPHDGIGEALWRGLMEVRRERLARHIGVSNYSADQLRELAGRTGEMPAVNQIEWSPFGHSRRMLDFCRAHHIVLQAYSPLTRGERLGDERLLQIAQGCGRTPAQVLVRWNLQHGTVPLPKANQLAHLRENIDVFGFTIPAAEMARLDELNEHWSALGGLPYA